MVMMLGLYSLYTGHVGSSTCPVYSGPVLCGRQDCRHHGTSGLVKPEHAAYQGPALISANDAMFSEQDWEGIQSLQQSIKAEDPFKVGRFGIGFNSVYFLTGKM